MQKVWVFRTYMALLATAALANLNSTNKSLPACAVSCPLEPLYFQLPEQNRYNV